MDFTIVGPESLSGGRALSLVVTGLHELFEKQFASPYELPFSDSDSCFLALAKEDAKTIGILSFRSCSSQTGLWIGMGYVLRDARRHGVYSQLWLALVAHAKATGVTHIQTAIHLRNHAMRACSEKLGRSETAVIVDFQVVK